MSVNQMRNYLKSYPKYKKSPNWIAKVDKMPDSQIIAVYYALVNRKN